MPTLDHPPEACPNSAGRLPPETPVAKTIARTLAPAPLSAQPTPVPKLGGHAITNISPTAASDFPLRAATPPATDANVNRAAIQYAPDGEDTSEDDINPDTPEEDDPDEEDLVTQCYALLEQIDQDIDDTTDNNINSDANPGVGSTDNNINPDDDTNRAAATGDGCSGPSDDGGDGQAATTGDGRSGLNDDDDISANSGAAPGATATGHAAANTQGSTMNSRAKKRAAVRRAIATKAAADSHAAAACYPNHPPNPSGRHVWVERLGPHGWQRVWRDPEANDFHDPPQFDRAAAKAYHDAMPQWLRDRMHMQDLERLHSNFGAIPHVRRRCQGCAELCSGRRRTRVDQRKELCGRYRGSGGCGGASSSARVLLWCTCCWVILQFFAQFAFALLRSACTVHEDKKKNTKQ